MYLWYESFPIRGSLVCILLISLKWVGDFYLNFYTLIKGLAETFMQLFSQNLKHVHMRNFRFFENKYHLQNFYDMVSVGNFLWGYPLINGVYIWHQKYDQNDFCWKCFLVQLPSWKFNLYASCVVKVWTNKFVKRKVCNLQTRLPFSEKLR